MPLGLEVCVLCLVCVIALAHTQAWDACLPRVPLAEYLRVARTGDLVFFRAREVDLVHDLVSGFTHVGVVFRGPGEDARLLEIRGGDEVRGRKSGVSAPDLGRRVDEFDGQVCVAPVKTAVDARRMARAFGALKHASYPDRLRMHVAGCKLWPAYAPGDATMMCSEFALRLLGAAGGLRVRWRCQTPSDVMAACQRRGEHGCASAISTSGNYLGGREESPWRRNG